MVDTKTPRAIQGRGKGHALKVTAAMQAPILGDGYLPLDAILFAVARGHDVPLEAAGNPPLHYYRASFAIANWTVKGGALWAPLIIWYAVGDVDRIRELLTPLRAIGAGRKKGYGLVYRWTVEPVSVDRSVIDDGILRRAIPAMGPECPYIGGRLAMRALKPPYYSEKDRMPVWIPEIVIDVGQAEVSNV